MLGVGEGAVGLVDHHDAGCRLDDGPQRGRVEEVAGRVVRLGDEDHCRLALGNRRQHRGAVEFELLGQCNAAIGHAGLTGDQAVHHEARLGCQQAVTGATEQQCQQQDQLIGAIAQQQRMVLGNGEVPPQRLLDCAALRIGVAVEFDAAQPFEPGRGECAGPGVGVLHGIELDAAAGIGDMVGGERAQFGPDPLFEAGVQFFRWWRRLGHGVVLPGSRSRHSAAAAWASSPSRRARGMAVSASRAAACEEQPMIELRFWKS